MNINLQSDQNLNIVTQVERTCLVASGTVGEGVGAGDGTAVVAMGVGSDVTGGVGCYPQWQRITQNMSTQRRTVL